MSDLIPEIISAIVGMVCGATIGSFVTLKIVKSQTASNGGRIVNQSNVRSGRDNIVGDVTDRAP